MSEDIRTVATYYGKPITELSREELIEAIEQMGEEILCLRNQNAKYLKFLDVEAYLKYK